MNPFGLARRFFRSLVARPLSQAEQEWVQSVLTDGEFGLWSRQPRYDQRHTFGVAREVEALLGSVSEPRWLAAALLHDIGKVNVGLGISGRVVGTLVMAGVGRARVAAWGDRGGIRGRLGRYAGHGPAGAELIRAAGGRLEVATWADAHHRSRNSEVPGLPESVVVALRNADRD